MKKIPAILALWLSILSIVIATISYIQYWFTDSEVALMEAILFWVIATYFKLSTTSSHVDRK